MSIHLLTETVTAISPMTGNDDLIGLAGEKINALGLLFRSGSVVAAIAFVIINAIRSNGAIARIVISGLAAGVFVWIIFNVTTIKDHVGNEVNSAPAVQTSTPSSTPSSGTSPTT